MLSVSMFAVYEAIGVGTEGDLAGRIAAGQVQLQQKD